VQFIGVRLCSYYQPLHNNCCAVIGNKNICKAIARNMYNFRYINAQQAEVIDSFTNTKKKLLETNAAIWFNKICRNQQLTPKYINSKL
jgi:hypothetical protein